VPRICCLRLESWPFRFVSFLLLHSNVSYTRLSIGFIPGLSYTRQLSGFERHLQGRSCSQPSGSADPDDHRQIPFKSLLFIPNDPIENQDYYTSTPVPKISSFTPGHLTIWHLLSRSVLPMNMGGGLVFGLIAISMHVLFCFFFVVCILQDLVLS